jgi:transcriptional regulator of arginine metabolism
MSKLARQQTIREIVQREAVASQDDLRRRLARIGIEVTQATLSRDVHEIGLVKSSEGYALPGQGEGNGNGGNGDAGHPVERLIREFVTEVREAQNLLVIKTTVGSAQPVAVALDAQDWPEVVGTVAGDDTFLVISQDNRSARRLADRMRELLA